jgi:hypothetical protein
LTASEEWGTNTLFSVQGQIIENILGGQMQNTNITFWGEQKEKNDTSTYNKVFGNNWISMNGCIN